MKTILYIFIVAAFILVTFFGLGPVLFADGTARERLLTLAVVIIIYLLLGWGTIKLIRGKK
ncbi:hypothetical protein CLHUN_34500 [Ruminiclostridium hungatei]|uniref:Uncharacterized protein n=1 Tax=Ruminiclostridium hungatei TaxID=48256 RepID=A0A1V4SFG6_RUMHU|nr:hypothetical protein [Ruminiclostridium hungatei]OPX42629.1 hypothetical protein CLHUN_34500 [Ruminiclostridium hungatei]